MTINISVVFTASQQQMRSHPAETERPIRAGADQGIEVLEPNGTPPGRWTRFKAALINVPLIGGLRTIRLAGEQVRTAQRNIALLRDAAGFSDEFRRQMAEDFGEHIAVAATCGFSRGHTGDTLLNAKRICFGVETARSMATGVGMQNNKSLSERYGRGFAAEYAHMWSLANHSQHQKFALRQSELQATRQATDTMVANLRTSGIDADTLQGVLDSHQVEVAKAVTPREARQIAQRCIAAVQDAYVEACNPLTLEATQQDPEAPKAASAF